MCIDLCAPCAIVSINTMQVAMRTHIIILCVWHINKLDTIIIVVIEKTPPWPAEAALAGYVQPELRTV